MAVSNITKHLVSVFPVSDLGHNFLGIILYVGHNFLGIASGQSILFAMDNF